MSGRLLHSLGVKKKKRHFKSLFSKHKLHFHVTTSQFLGTTTYIQQSCNPEQQQALLWSYKRPPLVVRRAVVTYKRCKHLYFLCISSAKWPDKISASPHPDVGLLSQALASTQSHPTHKRRQGTTSSLKVLKAVGLLGIWEVVSQL